MKHSAAIVLGLLFIGVVGFQPVSRAAGQAGGEWTTLFDGSSLDGWNALDTANWELADGAVQADSGGGMLVTEASYADFELTLEFWVDETANSGIFIRCSDPQSIRDTNSYEVNIYDTHPIRITAPAGSSTLPSRRASSIRAGAGTPTRSWLVARV